MTNNLKWYKKGVIDGIPIALGYFAVSFALGITARNSGLTAFQTLVATLLTNASAGGYAGFSVISENSGFLEMVLIQLIVNARYLLMACALSQKFSPKISPIHRYLVAFDITDEIFSISSSVKGDLNPFYNYGAATVTIPCWSLGAFLGVVFGNILPSNIVTALSVGLYGMFLAIIIPPAKEKKIIAGLITISMLLSFAFWRLPFLNNISEGMKIIILTVSISLVAAIIFPVKEDSDDT